MLDGRVAIVTGTSSGLGRRFAEVLDGAGARVVLASRRHSEDVGLAARLRDALPVACDVRLPADRETLVQAATDRYGQIDILVNNAGIAYSGPAEDDREPRLSVGQRQPRPVRTGRLRLGARGTTGRDHGPAVRLISASAGSSTVLSG
jgi:NAD(P)-dependent dehydrogenase (short-subunit alcohol dehydrogenase family)